MSSVQLGFPRIPLSIGIDDVETKCSLMRSSTSYPHRSGYVPDLTRQFIANRRTHWFFWCYVSPGTTSPFGREPRLSTSDSRMSDQDSIKTPQGSKASPSIR